uniref:Uncharacterized protein n=1 Tax=Setaria italica TaxID=4555 RepID=K3XT42_SETIT
MRLNPTGVPVRIDSKTIFGSWFALGQNALNSGNTNFAQNMLCNKHMRKK